MKNVVWPKHLLPLTAEQARISNEFMRHWHEVLASNLSYSVIEKFNQGYVVKNAPRKFVTTLEIGAGLGEHLNYEILTEEQLRNYAALELRENMAAIIKEKYPSVNTIIGDCQERLAFNDNSFDRIIAIHVLEHLPNLPAAVKEMHRLCNKQHGVFNIVIPCEGGWIYSLARRISAQRVFEKKYKQPYKWFIEREHLNTATEVMCELDPYFTIESSSYFPFMVPITNLNLCIGLTLRPRN